MDANESTQGQGSHPTKHEARNYSLPSPPQVRLLVGVREAFNQAPIPGVTVHVVVDEPSPLQRPPVVRQEWCESPEAYAKRVLDQMIDYVVQV